jgi:hypothetical protein
VAVSKYRYDLLHPELIDIRKHCKAYAPGDGQAEIDSPSVLWHEMARDWQVVRDLLGGTRGMRDAGEEYLPRFAKETVQDWSKRLNTSFLVEFLDDTIDALVSKPFSAAISWSADPIPEWMTPLVEDMDLEGATLQDFAKNWLEDATRWGLSHAIVDLVGVPKELPENPVLGDLKGARARVRIIPAPNVLAWAFETINGVRVLSSLRFYERSVEKLAGGFGEQIVERIYYWTRDAVQTWERDEKRNKFLAESEPIPHNLGKIPLVTLYTKRTGPMTARPPLMDLAWINVDHWQSYSDQRQILHTSRVPTLFFKGSRDEKDKADTGLVIGAKRLVSTTDVNADLRYVEPSGSAAEQGNKHLDMLAQAAQSKGSQPMRVLGPTTATGEVRADSKASCNLQAWGEAEERALLQVFELCAEIQPGASPLPEGFKPTIYSDYDLRSTSDRDMPVIQADRARRDIDRGTYLNEAKRRGVYSENVDLKEVERKLEGEAGEGFGEPGGGDPSLVGPPRDDEDEPVPRNGRMAGAAP